MPVSREFLRLPTGSRQGALLGLDAESLAAVTILRDDQSGTPLAELAGRLVEARPAPSMVRLESAPRRLRIDALLDVQELSVVEFNEETEAFEYVLREIGEVGDLSIGAEVVLRDARGIVERFTAEPVPFDPAGNQVVIDIVPDTPRIEAAVEAIRGAFTAPLEVLSVDLALGLPPQAFADEGRIELAGLAVSPDDSGESWSSVGLDLDEGWAAYVLRSGGVAIAEPLPGQVQERAYILGGTGPTGQIFGTEPGTRLPAISFMPSSVPELASAQLPVVVNRAFLDATASRVGDAVTARVGGRVRTLEIVGVLESFPTTDAAQPQAIADLSTLGLLAFADSQSVSTPLEWWIATEPDAGPAVAEALRDGPYVHGEVFSRDGRAQALSADPVALGIIGALSLGFVVAGLFAVIGLTVSAAVSARQRRTEFALLRALGLSSGQLSGWLWLENAGVVVVSLAAGAGLGLLIGWVVLPFVTVTQDASAPFPPPIVQMPWASIGLLVLISILALGVTVVVLASVLRHIGIGSVLRMGED
jgi:hypothetical protein